MGLKHFFFIILIALVCVAGSSRNADVFLSEKNPGTGKASPFASASFISSPQGDNAVSYYEASNMKPDSGANYSRNDLTSLNQGSDASVDSSRYDFKAITAYLDDVVKKNRLPAISAVIVDKDKVLYTYSGGTKTNVPLKEKKAFGKNYGKKNDKINNSAIDMPFIIGSLSKSMCAVCIMKLYEEGIINLDAKLSDYGDYSAYFKDPQDPARITIRELLNQSSGITTYQRMGCLAVTNKHGSYCYANTNYALLSTVIENCTGLSYADYLQKTLFEPLGMSHSSATLSGCRENGLIQGYRNYFGIPIRAKLNYPRGDHNKEWLSVSAGYISASISDMGKYLQMYLNHGSVGNYASQNSDTQNNEEGTNKSSLKSALKNNTTGAIVPTGAEDCVAKTETADFSNGAIVSTHVESGASNSADRDENAALGITGCNQSGEVSVLNKDSIDMMFNSTVPVSAGFPYGYGFAFRNTDEFGKKVLFHTGSVENFNSRMYILPEEGIGVAILANMNDYFVFTKLFTDISRPLLGLSPLKNANSYLYFHILIDIICFLLCTVSFFALRSAFRTRRDIHTMNTCRIKRGKTIVLDIIRHIILPVLLISASPLSGTPYFVFWLYVRDLCLIIILNAAVLFGSGLHKYIILTKRI